MIGRFALLFSIAAACTRSEDAAPIGAGGGGGGAGGGATASSSSATSGAGGSTKPVVHCTLDNGSDPVGLCVQKLVLSAEHLAAVGPKGVAQSWSSKTFARDKDGGGNVLHDPRDDVRYAASIAAYHASAERYGDTEATATLDGDLALLAPLVQAELATPPASYDGDLYRDLRGAAGGLRLLLDNASADAVDALAEKYGRAIHASHFHALGAGDGVLGDDQGGSIAYAPDGVATGALALIDLARRHPDEAKNAAAWQAAAAALFDHLWARARDPATGLCWSALSVGADPSSDAPAPGAALAAEVQASFALSLLRAHELVVKNPTALAPLAGYPFQARAEALIAALGPLWDKGSGGYREGLDPLTHAPLAGQSTRADALMFAAVHRAVLDGKGPLDELKPLRSLLEARTPLHVGLLAIISNQNGYFRRAPKGFDFDAVPPGPDPHERSYSSAAIAAAIDGLGEGWYGLPD